MRGPDTKVIDLKGRTVIPGLNDSHLHAHSRRIELQPGVALGRRAVAGRGLRMLREQARERLRRQWVRVVGGWTNFSSSSAGCRRSRR